MDTNLSQKNSDPIPEFAAHLSSIADLQQRSIVSDLLRWISQNFPHLTPVIAWNQPMFTDHGTYIIGFSVAKNHFSVAPEKETMTKFTREIEQAGYDQTALLFRIKWGQPVNLVLLEEIIRFNIKDKEKCTSFWR